MRRQEIVYKMLARFIDYFKQKPLLVILVIAGVVFLPWLSMHILTTADWGFIYQEPLRENLFPTVWSAWNGFGSQDILLWRTPYNLLAGLFGLFGFNSSIADKFLVFWPIIFILPISSFLLTKKVLRSNIAALVGSIVFTFNTYFLAISTQGHVLINIASGFSVLSLLLFMYALEKRQSNYFVLTSLGLFTTGFYDFRLLYITLGVLTFYFIFYLIFIRNQINLKELLGKLIIPTAICLVIFVLINFYWVIALAVGAGFLDNSILERTLFGNRFWGLSSALTLFHPFWTGDKLEWFKVQPIPLYFWLIPIFASLGLYLNRKNKKVLFFGLLALLGVLLSKQVAPPFTGLYLLLHETVPGFNAFREASKFYLLIALGYSVLIGAFVDWLWRNWTKRRWQVYGKYPLTILVVCLFMWNTKPLITGEIGTLFVPRDIPKDYLVLRDFMLKQPEYFRTYWVPRDSRWGIYTNNHPKISGVDAVQSNWKQLMRHSQQGNSSLVQNQIVDIFKQPYGGDLLSGAGVKYVIVPTQDKENDDDFFVHYGNDRQFYIDTLDKIDFLKRIDIGTKDLVVYENKNYKPHVSAQSSLVGLENFDNLGDEYNFLLGNGFQEPSFFLNKETDLPGTRLKSLFSDPHIGKDIESLKITDSLILPKNISAKLYKNSSVATLSYVATKNKLEIIQKTPSNPLLNSTVLDFSGSTEIKTIDRILLKQNLRYFLQIDESAVPVVSDKTHNVGRIDDKSLIELRTAGKNLIANPSFEKGLWQQQVGDCNNYDSNGKVSMSLNKDNKKWTNGKQSLKLEATRHVACTTINIGLDNSGRHLLSFDYQSPDSKQAGYNLQFNDAQKTIISVKLPILETNQWQTVAKNLDVPAGATQASLTVYAYESDKRTNNAVFYDNFNFNQTELVKTIKQPSGAVNFEQTDVILNSEENKFELNSVDYDGSNLIENPSLEDGLWSKPVGDCHAYDDKPELDMKLETGNKTEGNQSLQLEATRHNACTGKDITLGDGGNHLLSFDVQGQDTKQAGYNLQFNDDKKTVLSEKIDIKKPGDWQEFKKKVKVPAGATSASLGVYAYESDGITKNIVRYDNFKFIKIPDLDNTFYLLIKAETELQAPKQISHTAVNPTKKAVAVEGAAKPFALSFAESFHPAWKLYLQPINNDKLDCKPVNTSLTYADDALSKNVECQSNQQFMQGDEMGYIRQKPIFDDKHFKLNGYANGWIVDPAYIKANYSPEYYHENPDGSININLVMYFEPQSYFYIGLIISGTTLVGCISYLIWSAANKKRRHYAYSANPSRKKVVSVR